MKRTLTLVLLTFFFSIAFSQTIRLEWAGSSIIDYGSHKVTLPSFKNNGFTYEEGSIYYRSSEKYAGTDQKTTNYTWEKMNQKDLFDLNINQLPKEDRGEVSYYTNPYTQEKTANIKVSALKYDKGSVYRLTSFSLVNDDKKSQNPSLNLGRMGTTENPLKTGNFYKIKVDKSGIFKITTSFLRDNGINPSNVNPQNFRIYGNGGLMLPEHNQDTRFPALQENAIQVVGEGDGVWNEEDYALFMHRDPTDLTFIKRPTTEREIAEMRPEWINPQILSIFMRISPTISLISIQDREKGFRKLTNPSTPTSFQDTTIISM